MIDLNGTQAAIRAKYSKHSANEQAARLLAKDSIQAEIKRLKEKQAARIELKADDVLRELMRLAFVDIRKAFDENGNLKPIDQIPDEVAAALRGIDAEELWEGRGEDRKRIGTLRKIKLHDKTKALEMLARYLRLYDPDDGRSKDIETLGQIIKDVCSLTRGSNGQEKEVKKVP